MGQNDWEDNLKERPSKKLKGLQSTNSPLLILGSPCDLGVIRNGGKRGAKHGPAALMASFQSLVAPNDESTYDYQEFNPRNNDPNQFEKIQTDECQNFETLINIDDHAQKILHLGGGHDHIYPLASTLAKTFGPLLILNIDAHLDTRPDEVVHSGTPFRQIQNSSDLKLYQIGIHSFANGPENYEGMGTMEVLPPKPPAELDQDLTKILKANQDRLLILSVDCDGLDASFMPAVSAPNHYGLSQEHFEVILKRCQAFWSNSTRPQVMGLYEFNPIYDGLPQSCARYLAGQMYKFFYGETHE